MGKVTSKIIVNFTAINKRGGGSFQETYIIETKEELEDAVEKFDEACPFGRYEMETDARREGDKPLTKKQRQWFEDQDDIGFN